MKTSQIAERGDATAEPLHHWLHQNADSSERQIIEMVAALVERNATSMLFDAIALTFGADAFSRLASALQSMMDSDR